jgi:transposase
MAPEELPLKGRMPSRAITYKPTQAGLPRRAWGAHVERAGAQLSDAHPGCHPHHESHQSAVSQQAIPCAGATVYAPRHRAEWLAKITEPGVRIRAERLYQQLDLLQAVRLAARREFLVESYKHGAVKLLRQIPSIGPIRSALRVALLQTPHRFRTKRQLWAYETHDSGEYRNVRGKLQRNRERITVRGLNDNHNRDLKNLFKSAAISASTRPGPLRDFYVARVEKGMRPTMARSPWHGRLPPSL